MLFIRNGIIRIQLQWHLRVLGKCIYRFASVHQQTFTFVEKWMEQRRNLSSLPQLTAAVALAQQQQQQQHLSLFGIELNEFTFTFELIVNVQWSLAFPCRKTNDEAVVCMKQKTKCTLQQQQQKLIPVFARRGDETDLFAFFCSFRLFLLHSVPFSYVDIFRLFVQSLWMLNAASARYTN